MFSQRLKILRNERGLSQVEFAKVFNISNGTIAMWETDKRMPDSNMLVKIAKYFGVSTDYLLGKTVFRNSAELYETWGDTSNPYFEAHFDFGKLIKKEREFQGVSIGEMSAALDITEDDLENLEEGLFPMNYEWAQKMANYLGTNVLQIFFDNDLYTDTVPEMWHHDIEGWEKSKAEIDAEAMREIAENANKAPVDNGGLDSLSDPIPITGVVPIVGSIPAGVPILAEENIIGYQPVMVSNPEEHFCLRVKGDSMIGAGIPDKSMVLIRKQPCAENGQIVACRVNGDEATLKRFKWLTDELIGLMPENSAYEPIIVSAKDFDSGRAEVIGVVKQIVIDM